jgi:glycosyltransferase involved in cell wall biosynthesis
LPQDRYIVGMVAANEGIPGRKAFWPQLRAFAYFHRQHPDTLLYLHTFANAGGERRAEPLLGMLDRLGLRVGEDVILADQYRYLLGYAPAELATLYTSMDVLMAGAHGEGFCVPLIEAQACGTPVVCGDWTSMPELCFAGWKIPRLRAEVYNQTITDDDLWGQLGGDKVMPRTSAIVLALEAAYTRGSPPAFREQARAGALAFDVRAVAETHWRPMLASLEARL